MLADTIEDLDIKLNTIEEAIQDIKDGKIIIVVDDEDRENEGDFICAADKITPELINFMARHGRGLICTPLDADRAAELGLELMVKSNTALHSTAFTVSIDLMGHGCTTGISAYDRATGIKFMTDPHIKAEDYARPGHIFPLIAKEGGVLKRTGHTEAAVDLAKLAGCYPVGVLVEILNEDGSMARLPQLVVLGEQLGLKIISIKDLVAYRMRTERLVHLEMSTEIETPYGRFDVRAYRQATNNDLHLAFSMGKIEEDVPTFVRVHSSTETGDILGMMFDGYADQLKKTLQIISQARHGVLLYMRHSEETDTILEKLKALDTKQEHKRTMSEDQRDFGIGAQILRDFGISKIKLISNHNRKRIGLIGYGLEIVENVHIE
jgi:3,4-dihydroxy 2-butanone 4-phosphate synthase / GTP cyclohydrolase II